MAWGKKKILLLTWYFLLLVVCGWALFEFFNPTGIFTLYFLFWAAFTIPTVAAISIVLYQNRRRFSLKIIYDALTILTAISAGLLATPAYNTFQNKAQIHSYINDLQQQGFNVQYYPTPPYEGPHATNLNSYSELLSMAKSLNATRIAVEGSTPLWFVFFMGPGLTVSFWVNDTGYAWSTPQGVN